VAVWRLRIPEWDRLDVETVAELQRGGIEGETAEVSPEVELVARPPTTEALKEIAGDVNREAPLVGCVIAGGAERAGAAPLRAAPGDRLIT